MKTTIQRLPRKILGLTTRLGVNECWVALFLENERRHKLGVAKLKPRTDPEITLFMIREFPHKNSAIYRWPARVRTRYNKGIMWKGAKPAKVRSYRYARSGKRMKAREFDPQENIVEFGR